MAPLLALSWLVVVLALAAPGAAFAQGSAGGSIGKPGKTISGEEAAPRRSAPKRQPAPNQKPAASARAPRAAASPCGGSPVGSWSWSAGMGTIVVTFAANGTASTSNAFSGRWHCAGGNYAVTWHTGSTDRFRVSGDGRTLSGTAGVMDLAITGSRQ